MKLIALVFMVLCIVGCESGGQTHTSTTERSKFIYSVDGKQITCIRFGHGASCNWEKYNNE